LNSQFIGLKSTLKFRFPINLMDFASFSYRGYEARITSFDRLHRRAIKSHAVSCSIGYTKNSRKPSKHSEHVRLATIALSLLFCETRPSRRSLEVLPYSPTLYIFNCRSTNIQNADAGWTR